MKRVKMLKIFELFFNQKKVRLLNILVGFLFHRIREVMPSRGSGSGSAALGTVCTYMKEGYMSLKV